MPRARRRWRIVRRARLAFRNLKSTLERRCVALTVRRIEARDHQRFARIVTIAKIAVIEESLLAILAITAIVDGARVRINA